MSKETNSDCTSPSIYIMQFLAQCITVEHIKNIKSNTTQTCYFIRDGERLLLYTGYPAKAYHEYNKWQKVPVNAVYATFDVSRKGSQITIHSVVRDTEIRTLTKSEDPNLLMSHDGNTAEPRDYNSRCTYITEVDLLDDEKKQFQVALHIECTTTYSFQNFIKTLRKNKNTIKATKVL